MHMNDKMKQFLPSVDLEKMKAILDIEERFVTGKITLEQGREEVARVSVRSAPIISPSSSKP